MRYVPHKYQNMFHKSSARFRTLMAGRRGGKSLAGTIESLWHADKHKSLGYIVAPTYGMLEDNNVPMLFEWLPPSAIKSWKGKPTYELELVNGSLIRFRSGDHPDRLRGVGIDWTWLDEASFMDRIVWETIYPTLTDAGGIAWITTTPQGKDWVYNSFVREAERGNPDYEAWRYKSIDNPHIDPEMIEKARHDMSAQMFRQEFEASIEDFSGLVYPDFDDSRHIKPYVEQEGDLFFVGIDVGWNNPSAAVLAAERMDHSLHLIDEVYESRLTVSDLVQRINTMVGPRHVQAYLVDPSSRATHQESQQSVMDQFHENGLPVAPANNDWAAGYNRMTQLIRNSRLLIDPKCENGIKEINIYSWEKKRPGDESNQKERPRKAFDHFMDAVKYIAADRPDWYERRPKDKYGREISEGYIPFEDSGRESLYEDSSGLVDLM